MEISASQARLEQIPTHSIKRNPENPRILFRAAEMDELLQSIDRYGVQVPISVYRHGKHYVLIDGERRWKCSMKLNKPTVPALVQEKPDGLTNLLLMFNIHCLREQWDLLTVAMKLPRVKELLGKRLKKEPNERELAAETGLSRAVIRRSKLLLELPEMYMDEILKELNKPKPQQKLTEDFFIEMERALKTVERAMPNIVDDKDRVRRVLIDKYKNGIITNIVQFRQVAKIARAKNVEADPTQAETVLRRLFDDNQYSIEEGFNDSVSGAYTGRDVIARITSLLERLESLDESLIDEEVRETLQRLVDRAVELLRVSR